MWQIILIAVAAVVILLVLAVASRPSDFRVTRTGGAAAPAGVVFENVNDLHRWEAWSPWAKMDPHAKSTFSGPEAGPGASMEWSGNNKVGAGRMTIIDSRPGEGVHLKLEFFKPFKATNLAEFSFTPQGDRTLVTWSMSGKNNFMGKAFSLFMNCDKMVGGEFEKGLASLDSVARAVAAH